MLIVSIGTDSDQQDWDGFVHSHPQSSPYHLFAWGQAIAKAYGHKPIRLVARFDGDVVGVLPFVQMKCLWFLNGLVALPFCDVGNCLAVNKGVEDQLLAEAVNCGARTGARNIKLRGFLDNDDLGSFGFVPQKTDKVRMLLSLPGSSEELFADLKSKVRSQVRKSEKNGAVFRWAGADGVAVFYEVFRRNMRDLGSPVHSRAFFEAIMEFYGDHARIGLVDFEGQCIAAGLILSTDRQTTIPWASTLREYNRLAANMLLYWRCLEFAADNQKESFDLGRSTEGSGTYRFKNQWGASSVDLSWYTRSGEMTHPPVEADGPRKRSVAATIWRSLPLPIASVLGPRLRRYIDL